MTIDRVDELLKRSPRELALLVVEAEKERDEANAQLRKVRRDITVTLNEGKTMYPKIAYIFDSLISRYKHFTKTADGEAAEQQIAQLRSALAELVRLKDLRDEIDAEGNTQMSVLMEKYGSENDVWRSMQARDNEYARCKPLAWIAARKALQTAPTEKP